MRTVRNRALFLGLLLSGSPALATPATNPSPPDSIANSPPRFVRLFPYANQDAVIEGRIGHPLRFLVNAHDPQGSPLIYAVKELPPGAHFNPDTQTFTWTPGLDSEGSHPVLFTVSDGTLGDTLPLVIRVSRGHAPTVTTKTVVGSVGIPLSQTLAASDPDGDPLSYSSSDLPVGAELDARSGQLIWKPASGSSEISHFTVAVSDGENTSHMPVRVRIKETAPPMSQETRADSEEWESFLQPGLGYGIYLPGDDDAYGTLSGVQFELNLISWTHRNDNRGPSHGRLYTKAEVLRSTNDSFSELFIYSVGLSLSLERNPKRSWLIPHYGIELGGLTQSDLGGAFQTTAFGGLHLWSNRNLWVNLAAGYFLVPEDMKRLGGFRSYFSAEFSLW